MSYLISPNQPVTEERLQEALLEATNAVVLGEEPMYKQLDRLKVSVDILKKKIDALEKKS